MLLKMPWEIVHKMLWEIVQKMLWEIFWEIFWEIVFGLPKCRFCETSTNLRFLGNFPRSPRSPKSSKNALGNHPKNGLGNRPKSGLGNRPKSGLGNRPKSGPIGSCGVEQGLCVSRWRSGAKWRNRWRYKCNQTANTITLGHRSVSELLDSDNVSSKSFCCPSM